MKIYFKALEYAYASILILVLIVTFFHYFDLIGPKITNISKLMIPIISTIIGGFIVGKTAIKRGWLEGLKFSLIIILSLLLLAVIFGLDLSSKSLLYYLIVIISSMVGGMLGINRKVKNKE